MRRLPTARRKQVRIHTDSLVKTGFLAEGLWFPLVLRPADVQMDLPGWAAENRELIASHLARHGGLLFRDFGVSDLDQFQGLVRAVSGDMLEYQDRATPRSRVQERVYTSTDYPPDQTIELHNENCYASAFPSRIFFFCETPARERGETPIADCRQTYRSISPEIRRRFAESGVMYVRNFTEDLGLSWREVFQVDTHDELEKFCKGNGIELERHGENHLRTRQIRPAIASHPQTGETVWLNQAVAFHISTLDSEVRARLLAEFTEERIPKNVYYGDGTAIEPEVLAEIREAYRQSTVDVAWQRGDVLMLDNLLVAHGRRPFLGPRKVMVAMAEKVCWEELDQPKAVEA